MDDLPFAESSFDLIWSEGAIYNIGFENGIKQFKKFLKDDGVLAVSEITWLTAQRPDEITQYWETNYPEIPMFKKYKDYYSYGFYIAQKVK
tara:strand:- start:703 stop:975 length:273 start_codon:yes stop_codon:yes gene_type:complete